MSRLPLSGFAIGDVIVDPPVVLAPLAGFTSLPLRLLCRRAGAGMVCSEMVSAHAVCYNDRKTLALMATCEAEQPLSMQLFGASPEHMARATAVAVAAGAAVIDINMGCTVPKVARNGAGVGLLGDHIRACEVVAAAVENSNRPVTVKIRAGCEPGDDSYLELARRLVECGVAAIAIHGRTASQAFRGDVDLQAIRRLVEAVPVPVIGSGDIRKPCDAVRMVEETGCAGVMVGRGALSDPSLLGRCAAVLTGGADTTGLSERSRLAAGLCVAQLLALTLGETAAVRQSRSLLAWLSKGLSGGAELRSRLFQAGSLRELADILTRWAGSHCEGPI